MYAFLENDQIERAAQSYQHELENGAPVQLCLKCERDHKPHAHNVKALFCSHCGERLTEGTMKARDWLQLEEPHLAFTYANGRCCGGIIYTKYPIWIDVTNGFMFVQYEGEYVQTRRLQTDPMGLGREIMKQGDAANKSQKPKGRRRRRTNNAPF